MDQVPQEVATLRQLIPTNSTIMMDVQWHWTNLWWAGKKRNWPLAQYYFNESRGHIQQLVRKNPTIRNQVDGTDVELQGIFDGIDTSSLAMVKDAIEKKDALGFEKNYKTHARELLLLPQERRTSVHPPADSDGSGAGDGQHGPQRDVAAVIGPINPRAETLGNYGFFIAESQCSSALPSLIRHMSNQVVV